MSLFLENPFSVLQYADGDDVVPVVTEKAEKNPSVKAKHNNQQKQQVFSDQSRLIRVPHRLGWKSRNGERDRVLQNGNGFNRFDNGAPRSYNGQRKGGNYIGQHDINEYSQNRQGNGYDNLNEQPPDGDYSSDGGWNFVGEKRRGPQRRRMRSWRINSSGFGGPNEVVKGEKFFPKPKDCDDKSVRVGVEGEETTEQTRSDYSSEGGWNFVGENRGGPQRRTRSWRINSSRLGGLNEVVKGQKFFPKPKDSDDKSVRVGVEGEETTEQITRRNQSQELIKKLRRNMTLKEYEKFLIQKREASEATSPAEEGSTLDKAEKREQCLDKSISKDFFVKSFKRRSYKTVDRNRVGYRRDIQSGGGGSGGQRDQLVPSNEECSENAPFNINIQDPEQFPCLNVVIKT